MPSGAAHHSARRPSPWWSSRYITKQRLSRTNHAGDPWLGRSVVSGSARHAARTLSRGVSPALTAPAGAAVAHAERGGGARAEQVAEVLDDIGVPAVGLPAGRRVVARHQSRELGG